MNFRKKNKIWVFGSAMENYLKNNFWYFVTF